MGSWGFELLLQSHIVGNRLTKRIEILSQGEIKVSDWKKLNEARVKYDSKEVLPQYWSSPEDGFNGMFRMFVLGVFVRCIASNGGGWEHVSVSIEGRNKPPYWETMCAVKDLFWEDEDWVVQFHPAKSEYVNAHPGVLHLWRYTGGGPFHQPTPHWTMVGPKKV